MKTLRAMDVQKNRALEGRGRSKWGHEFPKMEPQRICKPLVTDWHHVGEEQDLDPNLDPHQSDKLDPDSQQSEADPQRWFQGQIQDGPGSAMT